MIDKNGDTIWLQWKDLTEAEQEQAKDSYIYLRCGEEDISEEEVDGDGVMNCRFERMVEGYIFVNL